ncbi:histone deacetylase family protein [Fluviicola taffensis]|uniref:Histone deacetylase n=1 Tax=Fluviicola taffensis (strain DSM 16823 / NCIMB 13979 / RW262) TaxID=755732 RepID=F2IA78_FLUTR|nr:histone deacetylase [Fluviicola taffensis]AEA45255.1 Histone deacetylase [Fluviicola taffensis DSM 16823]
MSFFVAYHPSYIHAVPSTHRFPMEKYGLIYEQLLYEGILEEAHFLEPNLLDLKIASKVHTKEYLTKLVNLNCTSREQRVSGFVHNQQLIEREFRIMEGTRLCAERVENGGIALNIAGGTHHAYTNRGEGFCLLNDQAIAAQWLLDEQLFKRILIVDLDVHQGNGTAEIFKNNPNVFTFSMHGKANYPMHKEESDRDIHLETNLKDKDYLNILKSELTAILDSFSPDFIFYQCGVDILETDKLGKLSVSQNGIRLRDEFVLNKGKERNIPIVCSMGGGYSTNVRDIVNAHMHVFRLAHQLFGK